MREEKVYIYGKNSVLERLKVYPHTIKRIFLEDRFRKKDFIEGIINENKISVKISNFKELPPRIKSVHHQGIAALVSPFDYIDIDKLSEDKNHTLIFLDRLNDPQNLGAIIRVCACLGEFSLVIPKFESCYVNETVMHVACGGENYVKVSLVNNLVQEIRKLKEQGWWIVGATLEEDSIPVDEFKWPYPLVLVLGSEAKGIRYGVRKELDFKIRIPMRINLSLNVAASAAVLCYLISKAKKESISNRNLK